MKGYIYKIYNIDDIKQKALYIGSTNRTIEQRFREHICCIKLEKRGMKEFLQEPNQKVLTLKQLGWVHCCVKRNINLLCPW